MAMTRAEVTAEEIREGLARGESVQAIARAHRCSIQTIYGRLRDAGIRPPGIRPARPLDLAHVRRRRAEGRTYREIAEELGCSYVHAWRAVNAGPQP